MNKGPLYIAVTVLLLIFAWASCKSILDDVEKRGREMEAQRKYEERRKRVVIVKVIKSDVDSLNGYRFRSITASLEFAPGVKVGEIKKVNEEDWFNYDPQTNLLTLRTYADPGSNVLRISNSNGDPLEVDFTYANQ